MSIKIGYKKLRNNLIAELEILGDNNENRSDIVDPINAEHRCSKVRVLSIKDHDGKPYDEGNSLNDKQFIYKVGEIIETEYDKNIDKVCSSGIHYFLSYKRAKEYDMTVPKNFTGYWFDYYDNGLLKYKRQFENGKANGLCEEWYDNGQLKHRNNSINSQLHGLAETWYEDGQLKITRLYQNGIQICN